MTVIGLFSFALLLIIVEARYEAIHGDKKHWDSLAISFGIYAILWSLLKPTFVLLLPYVMVRVWFDYIYNAFRGVSMDYLGSSYTDSLLRHLKPAERFVLRLMIFVFCWLILIR